MYVAMTRAKENLTLSFARSRLVYGGRHISIPSRFLAEIPEEYTQRTQELKNSRNQDGEGSRKKDLFDEFGEKRRIIVQDWEVEEEAKDDFAEIDNW
jgi:ATP-dependent exoDNAse (exonuclease V) beta subunit